MNKQGFYESLKKTIEDSFERATKDNLPFLSAYGVVIDTLHMEFVMYTVFNCKRNKVSPHEIKKLIDRLKVNFDESIKMGIEAGETAYDRFNMEKDH